MFVIDTLLATDTVVYQHPMDDSTAPLETSRSPNHGWVTTLCVSPVSRQTEMKTALCLPLTLQDTINGCATKPLQAHD